MMPERQSKSIAEVTGHLASRSSPKLSDALLQTKVNGLALHSDQVCPGQGFVSLAPPGKNPNGETAKKQLQYAKLAKKQGAVALFVEANKKSIYEKSLSFPGMPIVPIVDLRANLSVLADNYYDKDRVDWIGVTGTNGKSSVADLIARGLCAMGEACGVVGTVCKGMPGAPWGTPWLTPGMTTPDIFEMRRIGAEFARKNIFRSLVECSSHGLAQGRLAGLNISGGIFTNLSPEHRDYHPDFEDYAAAKNSLFSHPGLRMAVFNKDDPYGKKWFEEYRSAKQCLDFSLKDQNAAVHVLSVRKRLDGLRAEVVTPAGRGILKSSVPTFWSLANKMTALAFLLLLEKDLKESLAVLNRVESLRGRMQRLRSAGANYFVDYAHTPEALALTLQDLRAVCSGRLCVLFGCGGERDKEKRGEMGATAARYADKVILTNDNPRSEDPSRIIADIIGGMSEIGNRSQLVVETDRRNALEIAVRETKRRDIVLVAGKGHEPYQEIGGEKHKFDDYACLRGMVHAENV